MFVFSVIFHSHKAAREASDAVETERFSLKTYRTQLCYWTSSHYLFAVISLVFFFLFPAFFFHLTSCFTLCLSLHVFRSTPSSDLSGCEPWAGRDRRSWWIGNMSHSWVLETWQPFGFSAQSFQELLELFRKCKNTHTEIQRYRNSHTQIHMNTTTTQRLHFQIEEKVKWVEAEQMEMNSDSYRQRKEAMQRN